MNFDEIIDRRGTHSSKWDMMEKAYGVSADDGLAMWVADMDFRPPQSVQEAVERAAALGVYGYYGDDASHRAATVAWMERRHGWRVEPDWIVHTHGLVAGVSMCVKAFSEPGDGVIVFTPVYHAFFRAISANRRVAVQSEMILRDGRYEMDLEALAARMDGTQKILILCSPHNPGGRVWSREELRAVAEFCAEHDLVLVSDEIHHDLVYPGSPRHTVIDRAASEHRDRMVICAAATKSFNLAGAMTGTLIIPDPDLRRRVQREVAASTGGLNLFGMLMTEAAYVGGDAWMDALMAYLDDNRNLFDEGVAAIPGLRSMRLEATYLAWVDFSGLGMAPAEFTSRVEKGARIAVNHGASFGDGGENFLRFNLATPRARIREAVERLQGAFADIQG